MKKNSMLTALLLCLFAASAPAQESEAPRQVKIKITDRKGHPAASVVLQSIPGGIAAMTGTDGTWVFDGMTDRDSIRMMLPRYGATTLSVAGMDSIAVVVRNAREFTYQGDREVTDGYTVIRERNRIQAGSTIDVQELLRTTHASSVSELLVGRVAGLDIRSSSSGEPTATIRGERSLMGSNEPLVVVDGQPVGTLSEVDRMINLRNIKTIDVVKEGSIYGSRGANGVIVITMIR
jgi:hypothetical protein